MTIIDTETTGLDPKVDRCIEGAVVRYSIEHTAVLESRGMLIESDANAPAACGVAWAYWLISCVPRCRGSAQGPGFDSLGVHRAIMPFEGDRYGDE